MNIAVVSGKGGAGKTFIATNLFESIRLKGDTDVELLDSNVEGPNTHIFLRDSFNSECITKEVKSSFPIFDSEKCTFCGRCVHFCEYNAIVMIKDVKHIFSQHDLCKSCGACTYACNDGAVTEVQNKIGELSIYENNNAKFIEGKLSVGSTHIKPLIRAVKHQISSTSISIIDSPPGVSSFISEVVYDANFVIVVAEPSVFGLHDLKLMVKSLNELRKDFGVVVNKYRGEFTEVHKFLSENDIPLLMDIPFKKEYARLNAKAEIIIHNNKELQDNFLKLFEEVKSIYIQKSMYI